MLDLLALTKGISRVALTAAYREIKSSRKSVYAQRQGLKMRTHLDAVRRRDVETDRSDLAVALLDELLRLSGLVRVSSRGDDVGIGKSGELPGILKPNSPTREGIEEDWSVEASRRAGRTSFYKGDLLRAASDEEDGHNEGKLVLVRTREGSSRGLVG